MCMCDVKRRYQRANTLPSTSTSLVAMSTSQLILIILWTSIIIVDALNPSPGCSLDSPTQTSGSWSQVVNFDGIDRTHEYSYPDNNITNNGPAKLLLYFHGWGGSPSECGSTCTEASNRGYATISMEGIGGESGNNNSWRISGSVDSGSGSDDKVVDGIFQKAASDDALNADDRTCNTDAYDVTCYSDCGKEFCKTNDGCFWTTCKDSVGQVVSVLENFLDEYCIDMDRIYAVGCSNGGMFTYELGNDARSAKYIAGISSQVGLPQYGYNLGPNLLYPVHHFGFWGRNDNTVPPEENDSGVSCRTSEKQGWFYTSSECTMKKWAEDYGISNSISSNQADYGISTDKDLTQCTIYDDELGGLIVGGCLFNGSHDCGLSFMDAFDFFDMYPKLRLPVTEPTNAPSTVDPTTNPTTAQLTTAIPTIQPVAKPVVDVSGWAQLFATPPPTSYPTNVPTNVKPTVAPTSKTTTVDTSPLLSSNAPSLQPSANSLDTSTSKPTMKSSDNTSIQSTISTNDPTPTPQIQLTEDRDTLDNASADSVFSSLATSSVSFVLLLVYFLIC